MSLSQAESSDQASYAISGLVSAEVTDEPVSVLLVDDDPDVRLLMTLILETGGCSVSEAGDGEAAWALLRTQPLPNIVVTDLLMPVMSGVELIQRMRSEPLTADLPIVVVSSDPGSDEGAQASALATAMMDKAFIVDNLVATVKRCRNPA